MQHKRLSDVRYRLNRVCNPAFLDAVVGVMYLFPHDTNWKFESRAAINDLLEAFGDGIALHHIGSTAVAGLYAKNCIDLLGVVGDLSEVSMRIDAIAGLGYRYRGQNGIKGREYFSKANRKVHLHIFATGDANIDRHLGFLRSMQASTALVQRLNVLKQQLHAKYPDNKARYQLEKASFYDEIFNLPVVGRGE